MAYYIKLNDKNRENLFYKSKINQNISLGNLAKTIGVSRDMLFKYKRGDYLIPKDVFDKLVLLSTFNPPIKLIKKEKYNKKIVTLPLMIEDLAEIIGVLNGDGHLSKINHEISVIGNVNTDIKYFNYLKKKFENLFKISFKIEKFDHYLKLRAYSKELVNWFNLSFGLPKGNKKGKLKIPEQILNSQALLVPYLKGLFDTDGTIYFRRKQDPVIEISSADKIFLKQIQESLILIGFKAGIGEHRVFIYKKDQIQHFFELIKPANTKHLKKYNFYFNQAK